VAAHPSEISFPAESTRLSSAGESALN
jgi:hypothetical protein